MSRRAHGVGLALVFLAVVGCGKKGNPLPPLRPIPAAVRDFAAQRVGDRIDLTLVVPADNTDGSTPPAVSRIDVFGATTAEGAPAPPAADIIARPASVRQIAIAAAGDTPAASASAPAPPAPGDVVSVTERVDLVRARGGAAAAAVHYVAVPVAGGGRGRPGAPTEVVTVPLHAGPPPPANVAVSHDETDIRVTWDAAATAQTYRVFAATRSDATATQRELLTPTPLAVTEFVIPVEFGVERCFLVRAVTTTGRATVEGEAGEAQCLTPVDRYPPPAPGRLETVQEGTAMTLIWAPVDASDLAGYIVLRADEAGDRLQPLMRDPVTQASYRDTTVLPGRSYVYAVIALDRLGNPSEQSNRQAVTVR